MKQTGLQSRGITRRFGALAGKEDVTMRRFFGFPGFQPMARGGGHQEKTQELSWL
jgi:hypothetical protein